MISLLLPLVGIAAGFLALIVFRSHRWAAVLGASVIPPLLLSVYAFAKLGTYAWAGLLVTFVTWCVFVAFGSMLATLVVRPKRGDG